MSVTPDFVGQVYKDTNTGNIWRANSTTPGDWTLEVQNFNVKWEPTSIALEDTVSFNAVDCTAFNFLGANATGGIYLDGCPNLTSLTAPNLVTVTDFYCNNNPLVTALSLPSLVSSSVDIYCQINAVLATFAAASLEQVGNDIFIGENSDLVSIDLSALTDVTNVCDLYTNPSCTSILLTNLETVGDKLGFDGNAITTLSLPALTSVGGDIVGGNAVLQTVDIPSLTALGGGLLLTDSALTQACVNAVLAQLVSIPTWGNGGETCNLSGGTSAAPAGQGVTDKNTLIARGATVTTN